MRTEPSDLGFGITKKSMQAQKDTLLQVSGRTGKDAENYEHHVKYSEAAGNTFSY